MSTGGTADILDVAENHFKQKIDPEVPFPPDFNRDRIKTNTPNSRDTYRMETAVNNTPETKSSPVVDKIQKTPEVCIEPTKTSDVPGKLDVKSGRQKNTRILCAILSIMCNRGR